MSFWKANLIARLKSSVITPDMSPKYVLTLVFLVVSVGCMQHVKLELPPPATAPVEERVQAFEQLKPRIYHEFRTVNQFGATVSSSTSLLLANGKKVYYPEDLLPVVGPDSLLKDPIAKYFEHLRLSNALSWSGITVEIIGLGVYLGGISNDFRGGHYEFGATSGVGLGLVLVGLAAVMAGVYYGFRAEEDRATAFDLYREALLNRLELREAKSGPALIPTN